MKRKQKLALAVSAAVSMSAAGQLARATTAYFDDFNRATLNGGTYTYTTTVTAGDGAAITDGSRPNSTANQLTLTNDATAAANVNGIVYTSTPTSAYTGFNQVLSANTGNLMTWTFNLQQIRDNPSGLSAGSYGSALILGATDANFSGAGGGYALIVGNTGTSDPIRLYRYDNGLSAVGLGGNASSAAGAPLISAGSNATTNYWSGKVTYNQTTGQWNMFTRNDAGVFADPAADPGNAFLFAGSSTDNTYTGTALTHSGAYWAYATAANQTARFDNFGLDVSVAPIPTPRNLLFDADATGAQTDGNGAWNTASTWINSADSSHTNWDSSAPDNATFGNQASSGVSTVDIGAGQTVGMLTFAASSTAYTLTNGTLTITGYDDDANPVTEKEALIVQQSSTINSTVNWPNLAHVHVNGSGTVLTMNGALAGGGKLRKFGTGTLLLNASAPGRTGDMDIETGTVRVAATSISGGISGLGSGQTNIKDGATLWLDATGAAGTSFFITTAAGQLFVGENSTLRATGTVTWQKNYPMFSNGSDATAPKNSTIHVDADSTLLFKAQIRNSGGTANNYHVIHLDGPGTVKLTNAGSDGGGDNNIYGGSWDVSNGKLVGGKNSEKFGTGGDSLNVFGFKNGNTYQGNTITVRNTGMLIGTENTASPADVDLYYYRAQVILSNGGTLASGNGTDTSWTGSFTTTGTTSTVATYDPLNPGTARSVSLVRGPLDTYSDQGDTIWNGNLVVDPNGTTGGAFNITRATITSSTSANPTGISVTPGVTITVLNGAQLNLNGTADALSDGTNHVNVVNNSNTGTGFAISNGSKNVGAIDGTGTTTVDSGATLTATRIIQGTANLNGNTEIRPNGQASGVSNIRTLNLTAKLNLQDNKLVTGNAAGTWSGTGYTGVQGLVATGKGPSNAWDGATGIVTSQSDAVGSNYTSLAVASAADIGIAGTGTWAGQSVTSTDTLVMYTYGGDANLDGKINILDYVRIDQGIAASLTGYTNGDFNYDGTVNILDYASIIDSNIGIQGAPFYAAGGVDEGASGVTAVPEPASFAVLGLAAAVGVAGRRRRRA